MKSKRNYYDYEHIYLNSEDCRKEMGKFINIISYKNDVHRKSL